MIGTTTLPTTDNAAGLGGFGSILIWFSLAIVFVFVVFLIAWLVRNFFLQKVSGTARGTVAVMARFMLDRNLKLIVLRFMDDFYALLVTQSSVLLLKKLEEDEKGIFESHPSKFASMLFSKLGKRFLKEEMDKLEKMK